MITYSYKCQSPDCLAEFQVKRSILESPLTVCQFCLRETIVQLFSAVSVIDMTPKTLGAAADRNTEKAGRYERQERQKELADAKKRARIEAEKLPPGMEPARPEKPVVPWWRPGTTGPDMSLARLAPLSPGDQLSPETQKYIVEGNV
jgi:aldehyde:ferredoxin oxidoreductase